MPKAEEVAEVRINGEKFDNWKSIEVSRSFGEWASSCHLATIEPNDVGLGPSTLKLKPGDSAQVYLAGAKVIDGYVVVRQASYTAVQHGLLIEIYSKVIDPVRSNVDVKPGQFKNYTFEQMANGVLSPFGVSFSWANGTPNGADKPFPKINMNFGESVHSFLETLARMRNVYIRDDENGNLIGFRANGSESSFAELQEGRNIKSATAILRDDNLFASIKVVGQKPGGDQAFGDDARDVSATASDAGAGRYSFTSHAMEYPGDKDDARMRADREAGELAFTAVEVTVLVQGWLLDSGDLWIGKIGQPASIYSPMLFPNDQMSLYMRSCSHRQQDGSGTETEMVFCLSNALGGPLISDQGSAPDAFSSQTQPAQPDGSDSV